MERLFRSLREAYCWQHWLEPLAYAQYVISDWVRFYNDAQPHRSRAYAGPSQRSTLTYKVCRKTGVITGLALRVSAHLLKTNVPKIDIVKFFNHLHCPSYPVFWVLCDNRVHKMVSRV